MARNLSERLPDDQVRRQFVLPAIATSLIERGWIGEKAGQGFYKRQKTAAGSEILTLDPATLTYRAKQSARLASLDAARSIEDAGARIKTLFLGRDKVGQFLRDTLGRTLLYTARVTPDIAYSIDDVDRVMQWGFGWELGPFEIWDAIGVRGVVDAIGDRDAPRRWSPTSSPPGATAFAMTACRRRRRICRFSSPPRIASASCAATPAPASSISATACSPSSSIQR